jgi:hypothetical protein
MGCGLSIIDLPEVKILILGRIPPSRDFRL